MTGLSHLGLYQLGTPGVSDTWAGKQSRGPSPSWEDVVVPVGTWGGQLDLDGAQSKHSVWGLLWQVPRPLNRSL